ncbi:uncharacterized protein DUF4349 [Knoellia remsis]|uniref:Uncharacterized protein DUF4349 n=1 Tax=Knoellia remsis TaxID=407159 RepID=A0A2T0U9X3_9MICO|nr:DUF4349 domain-containing protein [Knoellia remsis]PRY54672.1 uncharacterized protein DUF4349 [Knoellia remsis]
MSSSTQRRRITTDLAGLALAVGLLAGCSAGTGDDARTADSNAAGGTEQFEAPRDGDQAAKAGASSAGTVSPEQARTSAEQKLVRRASLQLKVDSLTESAARIRSIAAAQGGVVTGEELYSGASGDGTNGTVTISVPAGSLEATIAQIEKIGDLQFRTSSAEDVTGTYVDTEARVKSLTASVERVRGLIARASNVNDLVALENELSQRQAELDALTAQLASLKDSVAMSPVTVTLSTDDFKPVAAGGFLSGLRAGWAAFLSSLSILVTVLGAVLPFAVAIALVVGPLLWWVRRRRPLAATATPVTAPVGQAPGGPSAD